MNHQAKATWMKKAYDITEELLQKKHPVLLAIDGRCGSGKSTLARWLGEQFKGDIIHMDDFYLPKEKRELNWMQIPGGNMDFQRLKEEILEPWKRGELVWYRPFLCRTGVYQEAVTVRPEGLTILEGSYSHHPTLRGFYDRTLFLTCDPEEQQRRLRQREGERFLNFQQIWIPLEERYFFMYGILQQSDACLDTGSGFGSIDRKGRLLE